MGISETCIVSHLVFWTKFQLLVTQKNPDGRKKFLNSCQL